MASWKLWEPRRPVCGGIRMNERMEELRRRLGAIKQRLKVASAGDSFKFQPFSQKQKQILTWWVPTSPVKDYDGIIADGAIRSGKTVFM